ncbi:YjgF-like domain (IPR013813) [Mollivirus sibericum]|uniref:YjgF-like domain (IPR013813) n=1 Tax=Mollivirus sibericum TaxID=1678078 RepID=UPI0006B2D971|nr:YjgF-like domain (IPR013813) [Mollivirus sibericum]ALD61881.1 YjgF-like domain (IPR013813) [Mollivirus sibericum]
MEQTLYDRDGRVYFADQAPQAAQQQQQQQHQRPPIVQVYGGKVPVGAGPQSISRDIDRFSLAPAVLLPAGIPTVETSNTLGRDRRGRLDKSLRKQCECAFDNVEAIIRGLGCQGLEDVYSVTAQVVGGSKEVDTFLDVREKRLRTGTYVSHTFVQTRTPNDGALVTVAVRAAPGRYV